MNELIELLYNVKEKPLLYLGAYSLERLHAFISGCICYQYQKEHIYIHFLPGFQNFVQDKFGVKQSYSWTSIISNNSDSEKEAFYRFFDLLDEFLET